jgi:hypothetical protein
MTYLTGGIFHCLSGKTSGRWSVKSFFINLAFAAMDINLKNNSSAILSSKKTNRCSVSSISSKPKTSTLTTSRMKRIFYLLLTLQTLLSALGGLQTVRTQPVTQEWVRRYNGPLNDLFGPFLAVDKQGNSYIAGTHVINDSINILCAKYNTQGVQQWATLYKYPGEISHKPSGLALDSSGNAYVISICGMQNSLIVKFNSLNGSPVWAKRYIGQHGWSAFLDIKIDRLNNIYVAGWTDTSHLVIRYNTNGDSVWVRKYHPPPYPPFAYIREVARACTIDDSLNIVITGIRLDHYAPYNFDYDSLLVVKYSSGGVLRWESVYSSGYSYIVNEGLKITADQNGSSYIGGITAVFGDGVYLTLKYDRNGVRQWARIYNSGWGDNNLNGIELDRIHNCLYVTGSSPNQYNSVCATIKYNSSTGDSIWVRRDTGTYKNASASDIEIDSSGNIYITGATNNIPPGSAIDILSIKYSPQGNQEWLITYNGPQNDADAGGVLEIDKQNNILVLGYSHSSSQIVDYVLIKYSQLSGIKTLNNEVPFTYSLSQNYPNPFNPITKIKFSLPFPTKGGVWNVRLIIYDILGREIANLIPSLRGGQEGLKPGTYEVEFDGSNYASGIYFYSLQTDGFSETKKMVLMK